MLAVKSSSAVLALRRAASLSGRHTIVKVSLLTLLRAASGLLDIAGILLLAQFSTTVLGSVAGSTAENPMTVTFPGIGDWRPLALLGVALLLMSLRSLIGFLAGHRMQVVLQSANTAVISDRAQRQLSRSLDDHEQSTSQEVHHALTAMTRGAVGGVLAPLSTVVAEGTLALMLIGTLLLTSPLATLLSLVTLGTVSVLLYRFVAHRQLVLGQLSGSASVRSLARFQEMYRGYRELRLSGMLHSEVTRFVRVQAEFSEHQVRQQKFSAIPRYVLETTVLICLGLVAAISSLTSDDVGSLVVVTVFAATMARLLPSVIPLQAALSELQTALGTASSIDYVFADDSEAVPSDLNPKLRATELGDAYLDNTSTTITLRDVTYRYPGADDPAVADVSFEFRGPGWFAVHGESGSGKSTLLDLLLGLRPPESGHIAINGVPASAFPLQHPGHIAYLPQAISVADRSVWENVAFGRTLANIDQEKVQSALDAVGLGWLTERNDSISSGLGESGGRLSGGQLQRLGIARCLYENPRVLVLDESTSGLDHVARDQIISLLHSLVAQGMTVVTVAHDEALSAQASTVVKLQSGRVVQG